MKIHPVSIDSLNQVFADLDTEFDGLVHSLESVRVESDQIESIIAGIEILRAQHRYFFPMTSDLEPTGTPVLAEALELEAEWLCDKAAIVRGTHPELANQMLRVAGFSLSLIPHAFEVWLESLGAPEILSPATNGSRPDPLRSIAA